MELMAQQFPGAFAGYRLQVVESHQRSKVDTSGTAKAIVQSFQKLGLDFEEVRSDLPVAHVVYQRMSPQAMLWRCAQLRTHPMTEKRFPCPTHAGRAGVTDATVTEVMCT